MKKQLKMTDIELVAEFMGIKLNHLINNIYYLAASDIEEPIIYSPDSDWNQLMDVCTKINNLKEGRWFIHISDGENYPVVRIEDGNDPGYFDFHINVEGVIGFGEDLNLTKIEAVFKACVEFVKEYNKIKDESN